MSVAPTALFVVILGVVSMHMGGAAAAFLAGAALGCFVGGGKLVIFAGAVEGARLGVASLAALVVYTDIAAGLFVLAHSDRLDRVPVFGPRLAAAHGAAQGVLRAHPWLRRLMWFGVAVFVAIPFQGTGAVVGAVLGHVLGLSRPASLGAIAFGSVLGSAPLALLGRLGRERITWLVENPTIGVAVVALCLLLTVLLGRWFMRQRPEEPVEGG